MASPRTRLRSHSVPSSRTLVPEKREAACPWMLRWLMEAHIWEFSSSEWIVWIAVFTVCSVRRSRTMPVAMTPWFFFVTLSASDVCFCELRGSSGRVEINCTKVLSGSANNPTFNAFETNSSRSDSDVKT
jgi:hypothetical protein